MDYPFEGLDRASRKELCDFIDLIAATYPIQIIIADHGHELPRCMTHRLTLSALQIVRQERIDHAMTRALPQPVHPTAPIGTAGGEPVVDIRNLRIQYGETIVLEDFNWTVRRGERWAMVGRNGSGKTTVFSLIFADHPMAYSQEVYLFGRRRGTGESIWDIKKRINYLGPELASYLDPQAIPGSTREYIASRHQQFDQQQFDTLLRFFEADAFIDRPVRYLSSGQLQLALLISCFMTTKELLLLDEPFQFLSPHLRDRMNEYLQSYLQRDTTLILITHYDDDVARWTEKTLRI
jgi:molybdate transport system ATP-binding protein